MTRFRALKHRNFQLFMAGQLVSLIGTWMQTTAQLWLVYRLTGSAALLGVFGFANQIPMLVLASVGGIWLAKPNTPSRYRRPTNNFDVAGVPSCGTHADKLCESVAPDRDHVAGRDRERI